VHIYVDNWLENYTFAGRKWAKRTHYGNKCLTRILNGQNGDELRILIEWSAAKDQFIILKDEDVLSTHYTSLRMHIDGVYMMEMVV
jgi:hypothetical protein